MEASVGVLGAVDEEWEAINTNCDNNLFEPLQVDLDECGTHHALVASVKTKHKTQNMTLG